jgi:hypothetical protein
MKNTSSSLQVSALYMETMAAINLRVTKEVPLDADVKELLNSCVDIAPVCLEGERSTLPAYSKLLGIN